MLRQLYGVLIGALPLGLVAGIALGAVIWMHTHSVLARTGAVDYLPTVLAAAVEPFTVSVPAVTFVAPP